MRSAKTAEPHTPTQGEGDGEQRCPDCGHEALGSREPRLMTLLSRKRPPHCATHDRNGGMGDIQFCSCQHPAHAARLVDDDDAPCVEDL